MLQTGLIGISENLSRLKMQIPENVIIIAISKTRSVTEILEAYNAGQRVFGENKVQEITAKQLKLPSDIEWHFIGHLQTNKVKYIAPYINLIHSVDSIKLLQEINKEAVKNHRKISCLLQFHIATEETKFGLDLSEAQQILTSTLFKKLDQINIRGVMGMASFSDDPEIVQKEFRTLHQYFDSLKEEFFGNDESFSEISMGMSGDFALAIKEGSTMIRIGTSIFGERNHH